MKICSTSINNNRNSSVQSFKAIPADYHKLPRWLGAIGKSVGEFVGMPEQKLLLATTALMIQPFVDLKHADPDQKENAAIKSASKAIAGGISGVTIRALVINMMNKHLDVTNKGLDSPKVDIIRKYLMPSNALEMYKTHPSLAIRRMKQYNMTVGSLAAMLVMMLFTNKWFDVPVTAGLQDFISGIVKEKKTWTRSLHDVVEDRRNKIADKIEKTKRNIVNKRNKIKQIILTIKSTDINQTDREK